MRTATLKESLREYVIPITCARSVEIHRNFCASGYNASTEEYSETEYDLIGF